MPTDDGEKRTSSVEKFNMARGLSEPESRRRELILTAQAIHKNGESIYEIAHITAEKIGKQSGNRNFLRETQIFCVKASSEAHQKHTGIIINSIKEGLTTASIAKQLKASGYSFTISNIRQLITKVVYPIVKVTVNCPQFHDCSK